MSRHRDFDAARAENVGEPLAFRLGGEDFTIDGTLPAGVLLDLGAAVGSGNDIAAFGAFSDFFKAIVTPEDEERFAGVIRRVDLTTLIDLMTWIVEESTGRPLPMRSPSQPQPSQGGQPSRIVSLSPAKEARSA